MDVPVALGLSIAFVGSAFATVSGEGDVWFDSVVMFVTLLSGARYLELLARRRATAAIRALARSAPLVATRVRAGRTDDEAGIQPDSDSACNGDDSSDRDDAGTERIPAAALRPGDRVRVRPGEVVPADGTIRSGHSAFDESLLTGESNPVARSAGSQVLAGSINGSRSGRGRSDVRRGCHRARRSAPPGRAGGPRAAGYRAARGSGPRRGSSAASSCSRPASPSDGWSTIRPG